jgi:AcrR family transcriptional regulator
VGSQIISEKTISDTRRLFLKVARRQFAERGFYGTSLAAIADELGLTKQALIHHFGAKERLYGEVLAKLAEGLEAAAERATTAETDPLAQLEAIFLRVLVNVHEYAEDTQLLMREVLDNRPRAGDSHHWYLTNFLNGIVAIARRTPGGARLSEPEALMRVYALFGALNYFAISKPTLEQMFGDDDYERIRQGLPAEIRRQVRSAFGG